MKIVEVQFAPWDKNYDFSPAGFNELQVGDLVIVETDFGLDVAKVSVINDKDVEEGVEIKPILRLAEEEDLAKMISPEEKEEALSYCQELVKKYDLPMKLLDVHFSLDRNRINFAFYSDSRVDFRNLVKDLSAYFKGVIRLTQVGSRDEARISGDFGHCGRSLCCQGNIQDFISISSEMAEAQQVSHRGSDRVSGVCGKLMCCLSYEYEGYLELAKKLPAIGTKVNVDGRRGTVVSQHILRQSVDVLFKGDRKGEDDDFVIEVDINRDKSKKIFK